MNNEKKIVKDFAPYDIILLGGNEISCRYLFNIDGFYPIIIGKGDIPHIWLSAMVKGERIDLIEDNKVSYNRLKVKNDSINKEITIILKDGPNPDIIILLASYKNEGIFDIKKLDLNPIGLTVSSNEKELMVGNNHLSGNVVKGVDSFIALSDR